MGLQGANTRTGQGEGHHRGQGCRSGRLFAELSLSDAQSGDLKRLSPGLYTLPDAPVTEHSLLAEAAKRVPHGVVCLISALAYHGLTTQIPHELWLAVPKGPGARVSRTHL